ncbi:MAG: hypothetical protein IJZ89_07800 [Clostridia bacterium]|nr:hypothetical protein [Clostridia bacterium]
MTDIDVAVNILGGDTNKVIYDDIGMPSIVVEVAEQALTFDGMEYGGDVAHPAFIVNGVRKSKFYVSKYQNVVMHDRAYSLPMQVPEFKMNFDASIAACAKKGLGWHLMTNAEWAYLALLGYLPKGNNNSGSDYRGEERGGTRAELADRSLSDRILTGSGPYAFSHNGRASGIWDMNGNINEWVGGLRLAHGEIQIISNNDAADFTNSQKADSELWKAILESGELAAPGTAGALKFDYTSSSYTSPILKNSITYQQSDAAIRGEIAFNALAASGITVPHILRLLAISPWDKTADGYLSMKNIGERPALRGGGAVDAEKAGIRALSFGELRDYSAFGFRSVYIDILDSAILTDEDGTALATENGIITN